MRFVVDIDGKEVKPSEMIGMGGHTAKICVAIKNMLWERLSILNDEMEAEPEGYIIVEIGTPKIRYCYSDALSKKLIQSFTEYDFTQDMLKVYFSLNRN